MADSVALSAFMARRGSPGMVILLAKRCNVVHGRCQSNPWGATVVFRHRVTALEKEITISYGLCLVAKHHSNAELVIIKWLEY